MTEAEKKVEWCLRKAEKEGRKHKGVRILEPSKAKVQEHLEKTRVLLLQQQAKEFVAKVSALLEENREQ